MANVPKSEAMAVPEPAGAGKAPGGTVRAVDDRELGVASRRIEVLVEVLRRVRILGED